MHNKLFVGAQFGLLTLLEPGNTSTKLLCRCSCGSVKAVNPKNLLAGKSRSCGCATVSASRQRLTRHGASKSAEHVAWCNMKSRCYNKRNSCYPRWGGRGISVCDRWRDSFEAFLADMGPKPSPRHSIDRINNDGNYEPSNCRWAEPSVQSANRPTWARMISFEGREMNASDWARELGIDRKTLTDRLDSGWDVERALKTPVRGSRAAR